MTDAHLFISEPAVNLKQASSITQVVNFGELKHHIRLESRTHPHWLKLGIKPHPPAFPVFFFLFLFYCLFNQITMAILQLHNIVISKRKPLEFIPLPLIKEAFLPLKLTSF